MPIENNGQYVRYTPLDETSGTPAETTQPNTKPHDGKSATLEQEIERGERWLIRIGIATLLINTVIAWIYWAQLKQMQKATDASVDAANAARESFILSRNALQATSAGIIVPSLGFQQGSGVINVVMDNRGKGNAWNIQANYRVSLISLPSAKTINKPQYKKVSYSVIEPGGGPNDFTVLSQYASIDLTCFTSQQEAVKVEGTFRYDNSFKQITDQPFCLVAMAGNSIPCADVAMRITVNSDPFGMNVPPIPQAKDCRQQ